METINYIVSLMPALKSNMQPESQNQQMETNAGTFGHKHTKTLQCATHWRLEGPHNYNYTCSLDTGDQGSSKSSLITLSIKCQKLPRLLVFVEFF